MYIEIRVQFLHFLQQTDSGVVSAMINCSTVRQKKIQSKRSWSVDSAGHNISKKKIIY